MRGRGVACMVSPDNNRLSLSRVLYMRYWPGGGEGALLRFWGRPRELNEKSSKSQGAYPPKVLSCLVLSCPLWSRIATRSRGGGVTGTGVKSRMSIRS